MRLKNAYELTSQFALDILAGMEQETNSAEISGIARKGRKAIEEQRQGIDGADKDEDVRSDLSSIIRSCDEAVAIMGAVPDAAKIKTNHLSQARFRNFCRTAQEIVEQIAQNESDLYDKESLKKSVIEAQEKLSDLSRSYQQSSDLRANSEDLRTMLSVILDSALALEKQKSKYVHSLHSKSHHGDLLNSMIELLSRIEGRYCRGSEESNELKSTITMVKIDLTRELEKWRTLDKSGYSQSEYEMILQKGVDAIKAINKCSGGNAKQRNDTEALKQDCVWLAEQVKSIINHLSLEQSGKLLIGTEERSRLNSLPNSLNTAYSDEQARELFEKILQVGIDFSHALRKARQLK